MNSILTMSSPATSNDYLTVDFTAEDKENVCQVCGATPAGTHFEVISCRPCSAFFRRTVVLERNFKCKLKGNCPINKNIRSICSHCRFKKCLSVGMSKQNINVNYDKPTPKEVTKELAIVLRVSKTPLIDQMLEGYKKFLDETNKLFFVCNPEELFAGDKRFKPGTSVEYIVFNRAQLVYILEMVMNTFLPFKEINEEDRKKIFRSFEFQFSKLHMLHLNTMYFADDHDKLVTHYGRYMEKHNQVHFFKHDVDPEKTLKALMPTQIRMFQLSTKFKRMKIDEAEVIALSGLILWKEVHCYFGDQRYNDIVNQIYSELTQHERERFGDEEYRQRVGVVYCLLRDIEELSNLLRESIFIGKLMNNYGVPAFAELEKYTQNQEKDPRV